MESKIKCVARPLSVSERCLLAGNENAELIIKDGDTILKTLHSPLGGWDYNSLESACEVDGYFCADAFLGGQWVGSTEI